MADKRFKDWTNTATAPADDDYLALDGSTNGTRKISAGFFSTKDEEKNIKSQIYGLNTQSITNGEKILLKEGSGDIQRASSVTDDSFVVSRTASGSTWAYFENPFVPDFSKKLRIKFSISVPEEHTATTQPLFFLYVSDGSSSVAVNRYDAIKSAEGTAEIDEILDISKYANEPYSWEKMNVWFAVNGVSGYVVAVKISNIDIFQVEENSFENLSGENANDLFNSIDKKFSTNSVDIENVSNGKKSIFKDSSSDITHYTKKNDDGSIIVSRDTKGNTWTWYQSAFVPSFSNIVRIKCKISIPEGYETTSSPTGQIILSDGGTSVSSSYDAIYSFVINDEKEIDITFDPSYYAIYKSPSWSEFNVWFMLCNPDGNENLAIQISDVEIYQMNDSALFNNFSGENSKELLKGVDSAIETANAEIEKSKLLKSPSGTIFELSVSDDGTINAVPIIPSNAVFFGNSILLGSGTYGLTASEASKDYYSLINNYIVNNINSEYESTKISGVSLESITSETDVSSTISSLISNLNGDENLVVVQLGDNVNTETKKKIFETSAKSFLTAIRTKCKNARVVWIGLWYSTSNIETISNACIDTGCRFINITSLHTEDKESYIGALQKKPIGNYSLSGVSSVIENSSNNITIKFVVGGSTYETTLEVNSYSLSSGTLTYNGEYTIVSSSGVATHPGDEGMKAIANKFLYAMGYSSSEEPIA